MFRHRTLREGSQILQKPRKNAKIYTLHFTKSTNFPRSHLSMETIA